MAAKEKTSAATGKYDPDSVRRWALRRLMAAVDSALDLSRCNDPDYLATLAPTQTDKIKRIVYGNHGNIVSVEPVALVDMLKVAADIAGIKAATAPKDDDKKRKGMKLLIEEKKQPAPAVHKSVDPLSKVLGVK